MDHEAFEKEMIDTVNRHSGEWDQLTFDSEFAEVPKAPKTKSADMKTLGRGLKRTLLALITALWFAVSVCCFIMVATAEGYWAVLVFFAALVFLMFGLIFLYAQGIIDGESRGVEK